MKYKLLLSAALAFTLQACTTAQANDAAVASTPPVAAAPAESVGKAVPALWKVSDEDTTVYLFGTVHLLPEDRQWVTEEMSAALSSADTLVTELVPGEVTNPANQQYIASIGTLPEGQTLRSMLDDEQRTAYEAALTKYGVPVAALDRFEPWMANITLGVLPLMKAGYKMEAGVEQVVEARAPADSTREALETFNFQMDMFDTLPMDEQVKLLMTTVRGIDEVVPTLDSMVEEWAEGDELALAALMNKGISSPVLADVLLYSRNETWADWISERMDAPGTVFMAVGAGHLAGEKSVQDFLSQSGLTVTRVQ